MFHFLELELHGWDFWPPFRIPLDAGVVVLSGLNGSGKTTMLDAIRQLLHAPRLSHNRRVTHYLRRPNEPALLRAVVSNRTDDRGRRPFERQRIFTDEATLACALVPDGGAPEKRYAVLPGRVPASDLQARFLEGRDWLRPEEYRRVLENAGVSRSLLHILALEQGRADELSRQSPRQLFGWVLEARGAQDVLKRYTAARQRFEDSAREVQRQQAQVVRYEVELAELERDVRRLDAHREHKERVAHAGALVGAARLQARLGERRDIERKLPELRTKSANLATTLDRLRRERAADLEAIARLRASTASLAEELARGTRTCEEAIEQRARLAVEAEALRTQRRELERLPEEDPEALRIAVEQAREARFAAAAESGRVTTALGDLEARIADLERGIARLPAAVERTVAALATAGIAAELATGQVEVVDESWAVAVESALGALRFALCVAPRDEERAARVAREHGFPGPIVTSVTPLAIEAGPLVIGAGAPAWLETWAQALRCTDAEHPPEPPAGSVVLARNASRRDAYGVWVTRADERVLGGRAIRAQLAAARLERERLHAAGEDAQRELARRQRTEQDLEVRLASALRRRELAVAVVRLPECEAELERAAASEAASRDARDAVQAARAEAERTLAQAEGRAERKADELASRERELEGNRSAVEESERRLVELDPEIAALAAAVGSDLRARAEAAELSTPENAEFDLRQASANLAVFEAEGPIPPETVREERRALLHNMEEMQEHVRARQSESDAARAELDRCRADYLQVVHSTLHDYARRARSLAELAAAKLEIEVPQIENEDRAIDEAGIVVRIGFDGKPPLQLGDTSHSGGQQVIAGLVLLMAMAETEGDSFFVVDEPFAHLSLDRVDDVGRFLHRSGAQFLITVPTTLDRGQLDPAALLVVLKKKPAGETLAPLPLVART
jgi:DNA repair exonuclease SbcCD ATPase subunit